MSTDSPEHWRHSHDFGVDHERAEKGTTLVMVLTALMMVIEIIAGSVYGSMALLADGWHMATHVAAFGIALFAYRYARTHADNPRYSFGTGKVSVLGGFASAIALAVIALVMALESVLRMLEPQAIHFNEAIAVAVVGLLVNLASGWILHSHHDHHDHDDGPHDEHHHHDHNLRAAYLHVLADALTSVFAIIALVAGKYFGWVWLDPVMGLVGAAVITRWSYGLVRDTGHILLDGTVDERTHTAIRAAIEHNSPDRIVDLHVWYVSPRQLSATLAIVSPAPQPPEHYKHRLARIPQLSHLIIEVNPKAGE